MKTITCKEINDYILKNGGSVSVDELAAFLSKNDKVEANITGPSDLFEPLSKRRENFVIRTIPKLAKQADGIIKIGHPFIGEFSLSIDPKESNKIHIFVDEKEKEWQELSEEQQILIANILDLEWINKLGKTEWRCVANAKIIYPNPNVPFCPELNETVRLVKKYKGTPKVSSNLSVSIFFERFADYHLRMMELDKCKNCEFNITPRVFNSLSKKDFVLCTSSETTREWVEFFEKNVKMAESFMPLPIPEEYE